VLIILVGTFDMLNPEWGDPCGSGYSANTPPSPELAPAATCDNLRAITTLGQGKGIQVMICTIPITTTAGAAGTALLDQVPGDRLLTFESDFDQAVYLGLLEGVLNWNYDSLDLEEAIEPGVDTEQGANVDWTDDGLNPNATGALVFTKTAQKAIASEVR
jgi:hypothetical protein